MVGALGFEPRSAGFFRLACTSSRTLSVCDGSVLQLVIKAIEYLLSSFPCNWSPRYYRLYYTPRVVRERFPSYDALGQQECHNEDVKGPIEMLISVHKPIIAIETPQALGRIPTLSNPIIVVYFPIKRWMDRNIAITNPAETPNPTSMNGDKLRKS